MANLKMAIFLKRPSHYYTAPPPCRFLQGFRDPKFGRLKVQKKFFRLRLPSRGSVVVYIANGTVLEPSKLFLKMEKTDQLERRYLAESI